MLQVEKMFLDGSPLRAEKSPVITGAVSPLLSWAVFSDRQQNGQSACLAVLTDGKSEIWSSGWKNQEEQSLRLPEALPEGKTLTVSVCVRDRFGEESAPLCGRFASGRLHGVWPADWVTAQPWENGQVMEFERRFSLREKPESACLYVCGIGYHEAVLNDQPLSDAVLEPPFLQYRKTCLYTVLPQAADALRAGENTLTVSVAEGWRNNIVPSFVEAKLDITYGGAAMLTAFLLVRYTDGATEQIATDASWLFRPSATVYSGIYAGETFDAARQLPPGEGFAPVSVCEGPGGVLRPMTVEPIRRQERLSPVDCFSPLPGVTIVDFGQNIAGTAELRLPQPLAAGQKVQLRFAEELNEAGLLYTAPLRFAAQTDCYLAAGDGRDLACWQPKFTSHGFRYAEITGLPVVRPEQVTAIAHYNDIFSGSRFFCGDPMLNRLHENAVWTEKSNLQSLLSDCPQRNERLGWLNDATVRYEAVPHLCWVSRLFGKVLRDVRDEAGPDGAITCTAPYLFGHRPADPVCSSFLIAGMQAALQSGDLTVLAENFSAFSAWEDVLLAHSDDSIVNYSYYGDWAGAAPYCTEDGDRSAVTPGLLMSTGYSYYNCVQLAKMAALLGWPEKEQYYRALAEKIGAAFCAKWVQPDGSVATGSQGAQSFALWLGILPEELRGAALAVLVRDVRAHDWHATTGNLCSRYLLTVLSDNGYADDALKILTQTAYPSFGYEVQNGATTFWERLELKKDPGMNSHNHPMYGAMDGWFFESLCGIRPLEPGWRRISVRPCYPAGLLCAQARQETVLGAVSVRWQLRYGCRELLVSLPFGMTAEAEVNGKTVSLSSGTYTFCWKEEN